ncbi:MAG: tRNA pseudouridine(38-40) synthase TruA [Deferrisomatales bacterium]|nr:tRNA pseudouridine(38-40) synthase TruA [Deferrisomatales bacterium]
MRNIRLTLEYDGTAYAGWQVQDNGPTVQGSVETALAALLEHPVRVTASGRTDAGVHALGQAANFRTGARIPLRGVVHGLNGLLPRDIAVRRADEVPADFDSRRSAKEKTYQYFLHTGAVPSAFARRTSWRVPASLDLAAMGRAAAHLEGTHDFGAFRAAGCDAPHAVRRVHEVRVTPRGEYVEVAVRGTAFLRHMVRIIVGTLVEVGRGRRHPDTVAELLRTGDRGGAGVTAPPQGLFLAEVRYEVPVLESFP